MYFEVFVLVTYFEERERFAIPKPTNRLPGKYPGVTIIVPAWNEGRTILATVESILALDYPKERLFVFIIDDGSTDDTLLVAKSFENHPQVSIFTKPNGGKYTALNLGIQHATTDLIGCLDADSFVDQQALREIIPYFDDPEIMAVTPSVQIHKPDNVLRRIQAAEYMIGEFTRKVFSRFNGLYVTPGPFSIYRRAIFKKIGGFVHAYNTEDMEMALRMQSHNMKIENAHTALVYTVSPRTPRELYKQRVRWVSGFLKNAFFQYRHMFFNKKYGNLGMLTMPFAFFSIFIALFFCAMYVYNLLQLAYERYLQYSALGFHLRFPGWHSFDWFSLNLEFRRLIVYLLFFTTVFFVLMGARMVLRRFTFTRDMLYFMLLYGLIAPFWLVRSLYNLVSAKEARWR
jgi:cellulose synthase/poly-beta-1,6-N-acetylglucosamine synthase-like glycosyltransferase